MFEKVHSKLKRNFWVAVAIAAFHVFLGWYLSQSWTESGVGEYSTMLKTIVILFVLISIPLTLKLFSQQLQKIALISDENLQEKKYILASRLRVLIVLIGLIASIMCYFLEAMKDMLYVVAIEVVILLLCLPTEKRVRGEIAVFEHLEEEKNR